MKALILAGGLGSRLKAVVPDHPKPLAPVAGHPFLYYQLEFLRRQGVREIYFSLGYKGHMIQEAFGDHYQNMTLHYFQEAEPLGTGGAISFCLSQIPFKEPLFILNGDTYFDFPMQALWAFHQAHCFDCSLALYEVENASRYGSLSLEGPRVRAFHEKSSGQSKLINAGVYLVSPRLREILASLPLKSFSFEKDILEKHLSLNLELGGLVFPANFIDIGIPEDYQAAQTLLPSWLANIPVKHPTSG